MSNIEKSSFNPNEHLMKVGFGQKAQDYLEVKWRLVWFRDKFPHGKITTTLIHYEPDIEITKEVDVWVDKKRVKKMVTAKGRAVFHAIIDDGEGGIGEGTKQEDGVDFPDFLEKAETGAIGRAAAALGYGTQFTGDEFCEGHRIVDSPVDMEQHTRNKPIPPTQKKEPSIEDKELLTSFKRLVPKEELEAFLVSTEIKIPTKDWGYDEFKIAASKLATDPITSSIQEHIKQAITIYGKQSVISLISRLPGMGKKVINQMPITVSMQFLDISQKEARFYHDLLSLYDPQQSFLKVKHQVDSVLDLFLNPERKATKGLLHAYIAEHISKNQQALDQLPSDFRELFKDQLNGIIAIAKALPSSKRAA